MRNDREIGPALAPESGSGKGSGKKKPEKMRIYQIAKEYSVSSDAMLTIVRGLGVEAKSHMSSIDEATVARVRKEFDKQTEAVKEDYARKREVERASRRRQAEAKAKAKAATEPAGAATRRASSRCSVALDVLC